ncbi:MAG: hypothetical protein U0230_18990 [Polyangiales bacterium]
MAKQKKAAKSSGGRGSAEAIQKRRAARHLNTILLGGGSAESKLDGRTEKRRKRLLKELTDGKSGQPLKPIDVVSHVDELLGLGETMASIKKAGVKARKTAATPDVVDAVRKAQDAYSFRSEAWKMLGLSLEELTAPAAPKAGRGRPRKKSKG